jgi:hypothetical protein
LSDISKLNNHIKNISLFYNQIIIKYKNYLSLFEDESKELKNIKETYGKLEEDTFNCFEVVENYRREDFNDIIISQILNPNTKEIGNKKYIHIFIELLCKINENLNLKEIFINNLKVERQIGNMEYGFIDILISDKNNVIIVESKINGAADQDNQLARYYLYVKNILKKDVLAIVYIRPVCDEYKIPSFENYSEEYKNEIENIEKILVPVSIVSSKNKMDFCHGFLDICCNQNVIDKASIYIKQYSDLLKNIGGNKMATNISKEMFKKLYGDSTSVEITNDIGKIWDDRWFILSSIIQDKLVKDMKFEPDGDRYCYKKINDNLSLAFIYDPDYKKIGDAYIIGFNYNSINKTTKESLKEYLNNLDSALIKFSEESNDIEDWLIAKEIIISLDKTINEILNDISQIYIKIFNEVSNFKL